LPNSARFPLHVDPSTRRLVDSSGTPFLLQGDFAASLIAQLTNEDVDRYLDDRRARGFNAIWVNLLEHKFSDRAPNNIYGDAPFSTPGDYSTPNEQYFSHVDWVLQRAAEKGILVLLTPSYLGYDGGDEGWYKEMKANGVEKLKNYGRYLGQRYQAFTNVVWVNAGDYNPPDKELVDAIAEGLRGTLPSALQTAHAAPETAAGDYWGDRAWLDLNNVYTYSDVYTAAAQQYSNDSRPFFLLESTFEGEHGATTQLIRTQAYHALLTGATGQLFGNNPMWHFDGPGLFDSPMTWQEALGSPGARSMERLGAIFSRYAWWMLQPDISDSFLTGGVGKGGDRAVAAVANDGSFALVYIPSARGITLDLTRLKDSQVRMTWLDPTSGSERIASVSTDGSGRASVDSPGKNAEGTDDWVLDVQVV
jgi:hypothetical protein